jgi:tRNA threonylcarbamoyladenosine biosynthesis protein TsaB
LRAAGLVIAVSDPHMGERQASHRDDGGPAALDDERIYTTETLHLP